MSVFCVSVIKAQEESKAEPQFIAYYFMNSKQEKLTTVSYSERYVFLVLETKNAIGEKVTLSLEEDDGDYIYKNKFLTTKNSARFIIKKDIQKIKFIVYKESKKKHKRLREKAEANL
ncbi:MAG: hypothetical protein ACPGR5_06820 [Chitinophagales bacterium]